MSSGLTFWIEWPWLGPPWTATTSRSGSTPRTFRTIPGSSHLPKLPWCGQVGTHHNLCSRLAFGHSLLGRPFNTGLGPIVSDPGRESTLWLSHVPPARFESLEGATVPTVERQLDDGSRYRVVKVLHDPAVLKENLSRVGFDATIHSLGAPGGFADGTLFAGHATRLART